MESLVPEFDVLGFIRERAGNALPGIVPSNTYPTRDHKYVIIGAHYDAYIDTVVRSHWAEGHPNSVPFVMLSRSYDQACQDWTQQHTLDHARGSRNAKCPSGKVYDAADVSTTRTFARGHPSSISCDDRQSSCRAWCPPILRARPRGWDRRWARTMPKSWGQSVTTKRSSAS